MWVENDVRTAVEDVGREVALLAGPAEGASGRKIGAVWQRLLELLSLGPAPQVVACPHCGVMGMRDATRCGGCWKELTPPRAVATP